MSGDMGWTCLQIAGVVAIILAAGWVAEAIRQIFVDFEAILDETFGPTGDGGNEREEERR